MDHRAAQTPVRDQGSRPTCVGFAVAAAHEWHAGADEVMSPEDVMWAGHRVGGIPGREEITVQWALEGLDVHDLTTELAWPYGCPVWQHGRPHEARDPANRASVPEWRRAAPCDFGTVANSTTDGEPVILTLRLVPAAWYTDGPVDAPAGLKTFGSHAVLVVGALAESLVVKNSWGDGWQTGGYGLITREYVDAYGVVAHTLIGAGS